MTLEIGKLLRSSVIRLYERDLRALQRRLTFPGIGEGVDAILSRLTGSGTAYTAAEEFLEDLLEMQRQLHDDHMGLYADRLEELLLKVRLFGFHFATMDIRQDSRVHTRVVSQLFAAAEVFGPEEYEALDSEERLQAVVEALANVSKLSAAQERLPEGIARDTLESLRSAETLQRENGLRGVHRYIISNTRSAANVLEVLLLSRVATDSRLVLDVVPLFETVNDLARAEEIVSALFDTPDYAEHLASRGMVQTIMLGFSDGTKDGGYVTANWEIFKAKRRLTALCRERGVRPVFFDGRGGPPARGGGNSHLFYRSLGREIESTEIQVTVQGQTVSSKYGTPDLARYNLEQLISAGIANHLLSVNDNRLAPEDMELLSRLSRISGRSYQRLKDHPQFLPYLAKMTPLTYYGDTNIASRPTSRNRSGGLSLDSLRAIPFVGAWSQMKQNVPGYFGLGSGLEELWREGYGDHLRDLYQRSLFFRTLANNAMQSLRKTHFPLTSFLEEDPTNRDSIQMREEMIRPVLVIQQFALARLRRLTGDDRREIYEKMVVKSLASSVNASRNAV